MVRAAVLFDMGRTQPFVDSQPLAITDVVLDSPGVGELLVKIEAAGVCHSDLSVVTGQRPRPMPMVLGHEASGVVEAIGPDVSGIKPGDHVVLAFMPQCGRCSYCVSGRTTLCSAGAKSNGAGTLLGGGVRIRDGHGAPIQHHLGVSAFSEYAVVHHSSAVVIDSDVPLDIAALFGCAMLTGVGAVWNTAGVSEGDGVAVIGLGGVGLAAIMGAAVSGAYPLVAVDPSPEKRALARELGATHDFSVSEADEGVKGLGGVRFAVEAAGVVPALEQAFRILERGGTAVSVGLPAPSATITLPALSFVAEAKGIVGSYMGSCRPGRDIPKMISLWRDGQLPVEKLLDGEVSLSDINGALDRLEAGAAVRQIVRPNL
ncbi:alcohol dehydrogenase catalytic domain-containing protein [Hoyosella rhizosphaerae]|uniref:Alcohol dehydrogenase, zinc-containing n=2 Tax=Hoyosella rhizosphaerae TaxID=1755582 RepID=A0A916UAQ6_9ACTN|nr:alcohol dehydrogenase catalytic domain-containing protein [Hoyosella rhizosphaerae]GGC64178.1 putative alcohol dehydrogenase, zinc-containing [Hoyosella rhizosphaerae]